MKTLFAMVAVAPILIGCSANPILTNEQNFYGDSISQVAAIFEKKGLKCEEGNFTYPIKAHRMDLLCTYLEKTWICPEQYRIIIPYDAERKLVIGPTYVDRRKLCF